jgi:hypothetical protein
VRIALPRTDELLLAQVVLEGLLHKREHLRRPRASGSAAKPATALSERGSTCHVRAHAVVTRLVQSAGGAHFARYSAYEPLDEASFGGAAAHVAVARKVHLEVRERPVDPIGAARDVEGELAQLDVGCPREGSRSRVFQQRMGKATGWRGKGDGLEATWRDLRYARGCARQRAG